MTEDKSKNRFCSDPGGTCPICNNCMYRTDEIHEYPKCTAYPNKIPREILTSEVDHTKPYKGDNGIVFRAKE